MQRILNLDPLKKQATWEDVKRVREEFKRLPISTNKGVFDVDDNSFQNITNAINNFEIFKEDSLETGKWKLFDNTWIDVSLDDLKDVAKAVVLRAKTLHTKAELINAGSYQVRELDDLSLWDIE